MKTLPAIYKGVKFRSRTEARWAVFFDAMGIEWAYEAEGYQLSTGDMYLPDFYFPRKLAGFSYAEVKPIVKELDVFTFSDPLPAFERSEKFYQFCRECKDGMLLLDGWPDLVPYFSLESIPAEDGTLKESLIDYLLCGGDSGYMGYGGQCGAYVCSGLTRKDIKENYADFWGDEYILAVAKSQTYSFK